MLIKICKKGWESFTGELSGVMFENGVALAHMSTREAMALGSFMPVVEIDADGNELNQVSPTFEMARSRTVSAPVRKKRPTLAELQASGEVVQEVVVIGPLVHYTRESLESLADERGIAGVREVAEPLGIKGTSIRLLINEILQRQPPEK